MARKTGGNPAAHRVRIPPTPGTQLSTGLHWLALSSRGRLSNDVIAAAIRHQHERDTDPSVLIAAAVQYLVSGCDSAEDRVNRYWHIADQVSARARARYLNIEEGELI